MLIDLAFSHRQGIEAISPLPDPGVADVGETLRHIRRRKEKISSRWRTIVSIRDSMLANARSCRSSSHCIARSAAAVNSKTGSFASSLNSFPRSRCSGVDACLRHRIRVPPIGPRRGNRRGVRASATGVLRSRDAPRTRDGGTFTVNAAFGLRSAHGRVLKQPPGLRQHPTQELVAATSCRTTWADTLPNDKAGRADVLQARAKGSAWGRICGYRVRSEGRHRP